ncbi:MAG: radical SAM/SPASM domain-containing protein [Dehalococcoidales bacterium]|nr:radical SAM/SPASM domain-containing protein [Dehalococcoidales bacterium]
MTLPRIIQLEVTTACQVRCTFCARTALADRWVSAHLDWEVFSCLLPFVRGTELVHLQGWGEPLLHPRLWDMAVAIKQRHGRVSLTTNAMLLDEATSREACRIGFDLIAISVAGARAETNDSLRVGCHLDQICANISYLCRLKPRPKVNLVMQMMKPNLEELPELVTLAARLGVDEVIAPNLDYTPTAEVDALKAFGFSLDLHQAELTEEAQRKGKELGVKVHIYPLRPSYDVLMCDADPVHNVWITVWGEVVPCAYLALPCRGSIPRLFWGKAELFPRFSFGKVTEGLDRVLEGQTARSFREAFGRRLQMDRLDTIAFGVPSALSPRSAWAGFLELSTEATSLSKAAALLPPPDLCRNCYKLYGI